MKNIVKYTMISLLLGGMFASCAKEKLETNPTSSMSGSTLMNTASTALVPLNGIYRTFWT
jgi:hypothetical protein